ETLQAILNNELSDDTVNALVLQSLGFRYDENSQTWDPSGADPTWQGERIPHFIENRPDSVKLTRSIAPENKQLLKEVLGFQGYKINELTPQKTRRATAANWLLGVLLVQEGSLTSK
ncbi:MAG: DUF1823 family protein, partial [Thermostichus sp. BF3_bins_97]